MIYAGFWKRVAAWLIDSIIVSVIMYLFTLIFFTNETDSAAVLKGKYLFWGIVITWLYHAVMESSPTQGTLGKMALGIKVTDLKGSKIGFGKATGRYFGKFISSIILGIGYIMVAFTQKKQGLHDMMAGCFVVNRDFEIPHDLIASAEDDAAMEKIFREADARAVEEARRKATYPISEVTQQNEEFIALLKSAINENRLDTISNEELLEIFQRARSKAAFSNTLDIELSKTINTLLEEIKKRGLSQDSTTPQEIPNYGDSSFTKINKASGSSKWVYAIAIPIIVIAIALIVNISFFSEAPKAPTFRLQDYYNANKNYYGDIPLEDVAKDVYQRDYSDQYPDYETWKKDKGLEAIIQEDNDRRKPSFLDKLKKVKVPFPFRYDEESIQGRLYRFDRITRTVEQRQGINENTFKWVPIPRFKNLQHVRDYMAQWERNRQVRAIEEQTEELKRKQSLQNPPDMIDKWETERKNNELKRSIEDIKDTLEAEKRERQFRDMQQGR